MSRTLRALAPLPLLALLLAWTSGATQAAMAEPETLLQPFSASYRLEVKGWPNATIEHRLTRETGHWQSRMQAAIAVARGSERSRFIVTPEGVRSVNYASGYSLLGVGGDYRLGGSELARLPDRQAALVELSRRALNGGCENEACRLVYLDHRGREERLDYRLLGVETLALPAGEFEAVKVEVSDPETPERTMLFHFHPQYPGLLLAVDYHRHGERRSRLTLTSLSPEGR
ncbi:hypothetical protein HOP62_18255 [Halomonas sp. MCCC 1A17488]|uniref:DUF3108 domain-containing protein n=1 Tax=Billgrantia sulfidoxydans TaxID=2733484 RepID=A0ABX7W7Z2_9GAMM|nr:MULTISPECIES: hypothetical protein [Halomonas]MCE8018023.1 hypothetical protein [Halomonas sp. MCCC 1A17488]MCG3241356.1 hypothetical protein [Halomonas sp. MCCC 1A17488]QPP48680.1 hypothetical protein I4484_15880 [Halomonas sp. SS10-MC5]QTP56021.1 hypothetical protein HNO51_15805 [Halomonas sulfidoxydans]